MNVLLYSSLVITSNNYQDIIFSNHQLELYFDMFDQVYIFYDDNQTVKVIKSSVLKHEFYTYESFKMSLNIDKSDKIILNSANIIQFPVTKNVSLPSLVNNLKLDFCAYFRDDRWVEYMNIDGELFGVPVDNFREMYQKL